MGLRLCSVNRNYGSSESNIVLYFDELRSQASMAAPLTTRISTRPACRHKQVKVAKNLGWPRGLLNKLLGDAQISGKSPVGRPTPLPYIRPCLVRSSRVEGALLQYAA